MWSEVCTEKIQSFIFGGVPSKWGWSDLVVSPVSGGGQIW